MTTKNRTHTNSECLWLAPQTGRTGDAASRRPRGQLGQQLLAGGLPRGPGAVRASPGAALLPHGRQGLVHRLPRGLRRDVRLVPRAQGACVVAL